MVLLNNIQALHAIIIRQIMGVLACTVYL